MMKLQQKDSSSEDHKYPQQIKVNLINHCPNTSPRVNEIRCNGGMRQKGQGVSKLMRSPTVGTVNIYNTLYIDLTSSFSNISIRPNCYSVGQ